MPASTVTSKGQVTIPKAIRDRLGLREGDTVHFRENAGGEVVLEADSVRLLDLFGALRPRDGRHVSVEEMDDAVRRAAARRRSGK
jgi:AbrB family looped-hinge helix DNA binding protein